MKKKIINYWKVLKDTVKEFVDNDPMSYSSSIAFYTIFSMPAILIIVVSIAGSAYEDDTVRNTLLAQIERLFGEESSDAVQKVMGNANALGNNLLAKIIGIGTLLFSATTVFVSLQNGVNKIWKIKPKPKKGLIQFLIARVLSLAMVMSIGFLMLVSLIIDTLIAIFNNHMNVIFSEATYYIVAGINLVISLGIVTLVFAMIFKVLPDAKIKWKDVWVGAFFTTVLFTLGKYFIGFYLGNSSLSNAYGAAGSLVLLLIWVYFSSTIMLFGAQFTFVYSREIGHKIRPLKHAVMVETVERKQDVVNEEKKEEE